MPADSGYGPITPKLLRCIVPRETRAVADHNRCRDNESGKIRMMRSLEETFIQLASSETTLKLRALRSGICKV